MMYVYMKDEAFMIKCRLGDKHGEENHRALKKAYDHDHCWHCLPCFRLWRRLCSLLSATCDDDGQAEGNGR